MVKETYVCEICHNDEIEGQGYDTREEAEACEARHKAKKTCQHDWEYEGDSTKRRCKLCHVGQAIFPEKRFKAAKDPGKLWDEFSDCIHSEKW